MGVEIKAVGDSNLLTALHANHLATIIVKKVFNTFASCCHSKYCPQKVWNLCDQSLGLEAFLHHDCQFLEKLDISWCKDVTDEGVKTVLKGCPHLRHLGQ